jgi:PRTRC genetic system protein B
MSKRKAKAATPEMDNIPRVTVTLTDEACWITRHDRTGAPGLTYPAAIAEVSNAFNRFGANTGLLPVDTLFWSNVAGVMRLGVWLPPAIRTIKLHIKANAETLHVPLPGLMFVGWQRQYSVFALAKRPRTGREVLHRTPLPNVHDNGTICQGTVEFPTAAQDTIAQAVDLFFESLFNADLSGGKLQNGELLPLLRDLSKRKARKFPIDRLVSSGVTVHEYISGESRQRSSGQWIEDDGNEGGIDGIDPYAYAYGETENDDED